MLHVLAKAQKKKTNNPASALDLVMRNGSSANSIIAPQRTVPVSQPLQFSTAMPNNIPVPVGVSASGGLNPVTIFQPLVSTLPQYGPVAVQTALGPSTTGAQPTVAAAPLVVPVNASPSTGSSSMGAPPPIVPAAPRPVTVPNVVAPLNLPANVPAPPNLPPPNLPPPIGQPPPVANFPARQPPVPPLGPPRRILNGRVTRDDRLWYQLYRRHIHGLSAKNMKFMAHDVSSLSTGRNLVDERALAQLEKTILAPYDSQSFYRCCCRTEIDDAAADCGSPGCQGLLRKSGTDSEPQRYSTFNIVPQIERTVKEHIGSLIEHRTNLHQGRLPDRDGFLYSDAYKEHIESALDFQQNREIKLCLQINTDGFGLETNYNGAFWPVCLSILDLRPSLRYSPKNLIVAGLLQTRPYPDADDVNVLVNRLATQVQGGLQSFYVTHNNIRYTVRWSVKVASCDNQALKIAYDFEGHERGSCLYCECTTVRLAGAYRYEMFSGATKDLAYVMNHAHLGNGGFYSLARMQQVCCSSFSVVDLMHVYDEGVAKYILKDFVLGARRPILRLSKTVLDELDSMCSSTRLHTYYSARMKLLSKVNSLSAKDIQLQSQIAVPLVCCLGLVSDAPVAMFTIVLVSLHRRLLTQGLSRADIIEVADGLVSAAPLWNILFGLETATYKDHLWLVHVAQQLRTHLNLTEIDVAGYEHLNLSWKFPLAPQQTAGVGLRMEQRLLLIARITEEVLERGRHTRVPGLREAYKELQHNRARGMRRFEVVGDDLRLPSKPTPRPTPADPVAVIFDDLDAWFPPATPLTYYARIFWRGIPLATHDLWRRPDKSQQDQIVCVRNGRNYYGKARLFAREIGTDDVYVLLQLHDTVPITDQLRNDVFSLYANPMLGLHPLFLHPQIDVLVGLYDKFVRDMQYVRRVIQLNNPTPVFERFHVNEIAALGCTVEFNQAHYFVMLPSRKSWI